MDQDSRPCAATSFGAAAFPNLSEHTVKNYFRIFEKLGVSNRVELVLYALSNSRRVEASTSSDHAPKLVAARGRES